MIHESIKQTVSIDAADTLFKTIYEKPWFPSEEEAPGIRDANMLIIPDNYLSDSDDIVFAETTTDFYDFLTLNVPNEIICDVAVSTETYRRIEKRSALIDLPVILVSKPVLPVAINMLSDFLYDLVKQHGQNMNKTATKVKIIVEESKTKNILKIEYEGPVDGVKETLEKAIMKRQ